MRCPSPDMSNLHLKVPPQSVPNPLFYAVTPLPLTESHDLTQGAQKLLIAQRGKRQMLCGQREVSQTAPPAPGMAATGRRPWQPLQISSFLLISAEPPSTDAACIASRAHETTA